MNTYSQKEIEELLQRAFDAGYLAGKDDKPQLKAWLNHKLEARV